MDWADEQARDLWKYLGKCRDDDEELELIALHLRQARSAGKVIAAKELGERLGFTQDADA